MRKLTRAQYTRFLYYGEGESFYDEPVEDSLESLPQVSKRERKRLKKAEFRQWVETRYYTSVRARHSLEMDWRDMVRTLCYVDLFNHPFELQKARKLIQYGRRKLGHREIPGSRPFRVEKYSIPVPQQSWEEIRRNREFSQAFFNGTAELRRIL